MNGTLTKKQEALIRSLQTRHGRKKSDLCLCEGIKSCREILSINPQLIEIAVCSEDFQPNDFSSVDFVKVPAEKFQSLSSFSTSEGILFIVRRPEFEVPGLPLDNFTILLDKVSDPGNLGTIIRTVRATGLGELWMTEGTVDPFCNKAIRAALASQFALQIRLFANLADAICEFRRIGSDRIYITNPHSGASCFTEAGLFDKSLIIFGNEAHGTENIHNIADLTIPMPGNIDSINVAQSVTVILFEAVRRKESN